MSELLTAPFIAGLLASGLFLLVFGVGLGFLFLFLPTLPLFYLGLSAKTRHLPVAIALAALLIGIAAGLPMTILFLLFLGIPSWYVCKYSLLSHATGDSVSWFPIGTVLLYLTLYGAALIAFITFYYALSDTPLPDLLAKTIHTAFSDMQEEFGDVVDLLAGDFSFLVFPVTLWLWGILLYVHGWLANRLLIHRHEEQRADFSVQLFTIPSWMLSLLGIAALASLIGGESMSFLGKAMVLALMLPYFFLGAALMHRACAQLPSHRLILFFVYFMVVSQFWPALILAAIGLWHQIKSLAQKTP